MTSPKLFNLFSLLLYIFGWLLAFGFPDPQRQERNQTYIVVPGLLDILDWCDGFSFLLGGFGLFGRLNLRLSLGLLLSGFGLLLGLCGGYRSRRRGLGVSWMFGSSGHKRAADACSGGRLLYLRLCGFGALLTGRFVERALLSGRRLVTGRAHWLVFGRGMGDG